MSKSGVAAPLGIRGHIGSFYRRFENALSGDWATAIGMVMPSDVETETYKLSRMAPALSEWLGERKLTDIGVDSFTITNVPYSSGTSISRADWQRDKTAQLNIRVGDLAKRAAQHWRSLLTTTIEANGNSYDGVAFFAATHSLGDSGSQRNLMTSTQVPALNVSAATAPTEDEMVDVLIGLVQEFYGFADDRGEPINGDATEFAVMVPHNMMGATQAAIRSSLRKSGSTSAVPLQEFNLRLIVNPRLAANDELYIFRTDSEMKPFILQDEDGPRVEVLAEGSDHTFKTGEYAFGVSARRACGNGEPLHALKATLS